MRSCGSPTAAVIPTAHDGDRGGRGIAVKLSLDDGDRSDLLGISVPCFTARTPEDFVEYVKLARRDPETGQPDLAAIGAFLEAHPGDGGGAGRGRGVAAAGELARRDLQRHPRVPLVGGRRNGALGSHPMGAGRAATRSLTDDDAHQRDRDYLAADLESRLAAGPSSFTLLARLARDGDPLDDPTAAWPEDREAVAVGHLVVDRAIEPAETAERHSCVRSDAAVRRNRAVRRPDPALPAEGLRRLGAGPVVGRRSGSTRRLG